MHGSFPVQQSDAAIDFILDGSTGDSVTVPDAQLLFFSELKRVGDSLKIIGQDGKTAYIQDYFKAERLGDLLSPEGAVLSGDVVQAIAGQLAPGQYAQATAPAGSAQAIGRVATVQGNATVLRNGVAVTLNVGDAVLKGDVVQTGSGSALGITFNDGTAFNLTANAQMALTEYVYDAAGASNAAVFNVIRGTMSFVASQVAKTGDMKIVTPTATMGIRGTTGVIEVAFNGQESRVKLYTDQDGRVGRIEVFGRDGTTLLGTLTQTSTGYAITPAAGLTDIARSLDITPQEIARDLVIVQQVFQTQGIGEQIIRQNQQPGTEQKGGSLPGSSTNPIIVNLDAHIGTPNQSGGVTSQTVQVTNVQVQTPAGSQTTTTPLPTSTTQQNNNSSNVVTGSDESNVIYGTDDRDVVFAGGGNDTVYGGGGDDELHGGTGNDTLVGADGNDTVFGEEDNDTLIAGSGQGDDLYDGGSGIDTLIYTSTSQGIVVNLTTGTAHGAEIGTDTISNVENVIGGSGADTLIGTVGVNVINGMDGADII